MKNIYRFCASFMLMIAITGLSNLVLAQSANKGFAPGAGYKQVNFGLDVRGHGIPVYAGMDFGVGKMITLGPRLSMHTHGDRYYNNNGNTVTWSRSTYLTPSFRGDYHFSGHINGLPKELDFYGGLSLGFPIGFRSHSTRENGDLIGERHSSNYVNTALWIQAGARFFFTDRLAAHLELASSRASASIGLSYKL